MLKGVRKHIFRAVIYRQHTEVGNGGEDHRTGTPLHKETMKLATQNQKRMFFALAKEMGFDPEVVKERAKKHFGLTSFKEATSEQLN